MDEDDGNIVSDWPESPTRKQIIQVIDIDAIQINIGEKRQHQAIDPDSSPVRLAQRPRLQLEKSRLMKGMQPTHRSDSAH